MMGPRYWASAAATAALTGVLIGISTDLLPNPWLRHMIEIRPFDYVVWILISVLTGALLATYILPAAGAGLGPQRTGVGAGSLGWLAVGCPVCNKLVIALLGTSGALNYFAPIQPLLGALAVGLSATALIIRLRAFYAGCDVAAARSPT
jgi:hypothetical protein